MRFQQFHPFSVRAGVPEASLENSNVRVLRAAPKMPMTQATSPQKRPQKKQDDPEIQELRQLAAKHQFVVRPLADYECEFVMQTLPDNDK